MNHKHIDTGRLTLLALLFALAIVLSNIVVMFALFHLGKRDALAIVILKAAFVAATRGATAGILSLSGGLLAFLVMAILLVIFKDRMTYLLISIAGAIGHNVGQITAASVILQTALWIYLPVLFISGIITGFATSILLKLTAPAFLRLRRK
jgi:heptaprenyl diphosphate synthase